MPRNVELKVACTPEDHARVESLLSESVIAPLETLLQADTYFAVASGRLKLRRIDSANGRCAELIHYHRPDVAAERVSDYLRVPIPPEQADGLRRALSAALGELVEVRKRRRVAVRAMTRIHLDEVEGLGTFIELETVVGERPDSEASAEFQAIVDWLGFAGLAAVPGSYSDLMLERLEH